MADHNILGSGSRVASGFTFGGSLTMAQEDEVIFLMEELPSPELVALAERYQLPRCFFLYLDRAACTGCVGCNSDDFNFQDIGRADSKNFTIAGPGRFFFSGTRPLRSVEGDDGEVSLCPNSCFKPLVTLPKVEVKTGEEDEDVVYSQRAKLFRFASSQWKERGVGDMKILRHKETGKYRLLLRRDQIYKLACNHSLTMDMFLQPMMTSEVAWCWLAMDFADGEGILEHFALKFRDKKMATVFKEKFEQCQAELRDEYKQVKKELWAANRSNTR